MIVNQSNSNPISLIKTDVKDPKLGFYQVGDSHHANKVSALIDGTRRKIHPEWRFNNEIFDQFDWTVEPLESLDELYRQRAQQIRDRYDYVILMYSGGADSDNILHTCLKYNITIDEIVVSFPISAPGKPNPNDFNEHNLISEWHYTIRPKLDWISLNHPKIKITVNDWAESVSSYKIEDGYIEHASHNISPYVRQRWSFNYITSVLHAIDKKGSVGIIRGIDKPRVCFHNSAYRLYFLDIILHNSIIHTDDPGLSNHVAQELFYWSPDSCKMLAKQAHALIKFFEAVPSFKTYINWPIKNDIYRQWYEYSTRAIIYPELNLDFFQVAKPTGPVNAYDRLIGEMGLGDKIQGINFENWHFLETNIDPKYFSKPGVSPDFVGFIMGMWPLKTVNSNT